MNFLTYLFLTLAFKAAVNALSAYDSELASEEKPIVSPTAFSADGIIRRPRAAMQMDEWIWLLKTS